LLDIPIGPTAKVRSMPEAQRLRKLFEFVARRVGLLVKLADTVAAGDSLYRVHAAYPTEMAFASQACDKYSGYTIGTAEQMAQVFVEF
jgi:thymidine phosphorylase